MSYLGRGSGWVFFKPALQTRRHCLPCPAEERTAQQGAFDTVRSLLQARWPGARVHLFGSVANGLSVRHNNDIDVCLELEDIAPEDLVGGGWVGEGVQRRVESVEWQGGAVGGMAALARLLSRAPPPLFPSRRARARWRLRWVSSWRRRAWPTCCLCPRHECR